MMLSQSDQIDVRQLLPSLAWRLSRLGYAEYIKSFNPLSIGSSRWQTTGVPVPEHLGDAVALFLLSQPVERIRLNELMGDLIDDLIEAGILDELEGTLSTPGIVLLPIGRYWLFVSRPSPNPLLYVGDDSMGLLWRQSIRPGGACLDLCTGPGLQALAASAVAGRVDAVEVNPVAVAIAQMNVAMNCLDDKVSVHLGSLYEPVRGAVFDNVLANPPFLPVPDTVNYPFVGNGSNDGLSVVREILRGLPDRLSREGIAQIICALPGDGAQPIAVVLDELGTWCREAKFNMVVTITCTLSMTPGSYFFEGMARTAANASGAELESVRAQFARGEFNSGCSNTLACFLMATRGKGQLRVQDVRHPQGSLWFA